MIETNELAPLAVAFMVGVFLPVALIVRLGVAIFSSRARRMIQQHPFLHVVWFLCATVGVFSVFVAPQLIARDMQRRQIGRQAEHERSSNQASQVIDALGAPQPER